MNRRLMVLLVVGFLCRQGFAAYELNRITPDPGDPGRVILLSGAMTTAGCAVTQGNVKLFALGGQNITGVYTVNSARAEIGLIHAIKKFVLSFLQSVPEIDEIKARYDDVDMTPIYNNHPTNHNTPLFYWEPAAGRSPVSRYEYIFLNTSGVEIAAGELTVEQLDREVSETGRYMMRVRAQNQSGNWGGWKEFIYMYDNNGPLPVDYVNLQTWGEKYFHPLIMNLEFPFTEVLDADAIDSQTMTLACQTWEGAWNDISGDTAYRDENQAMVFKPDHHMEALSSYRVRFSDVSDLAGNTFSGDIFFKTFLGAAMRADVYSRDGAVKLSIPDWGLKKDAIVKVLKVESVVESIDKADRKIELMMNTQLAGSSVYKVDIVDLSFQPIETFNKNALFSFYIPDQDNDGIWDHARIRIKDVRLACLNEERKAWEMLGDDTARISRSPEQPSMQSISLPVEKARYYRLISYLAPADTMDNVLIYPNPFCPAKGHTEVTFLRLPARVTIKIYNLAGEMIRAFREPDQGQVLWDGMNEYGERVASGVYFALVESHGSQKIFKLAIER